MIKNHIVYIPLPPLCWCAMLMLIGIGISSLDPTSRIQWYYFVVLALSCLIIVAFLYKKLTYIFLIASFFFGGFYRYASYLRHYQKSQAFLCNKSLTGFARVEQCTTSAKQFKTCLTITITELQDRDLPAPAIVRLYLKEKCTLQPDDIISFTNLMFKKQKNKNSNWHLCKENVIGCSYKKKVSFRLLYRPLVSIKRYCETKKRVIAATIASSLSQRAHTLFLALFLGKKEASYSYVSIRRYCTYWGIVHYLARSGIHVVVLVGLWISLLTAFSLSSLCRQAILALGMCFYYLLSWTSISFMRAIILFYMYQGYFIIGRSPNMLHMIAMTTIILLIGNPTSLFFIDFQLSFGITFLLALLREINHQRARATPTSI